MNILQAALLGVIQGLAEFLPISSRGHLELAQRLMGLQADSQAMLLLTVLLHAGTLIAIIVVFWQDWIGILRDKIIGSRLFWLLVLASLPALAAAVLLDVDQLFGGGFLGIGFLITGVFLLLVEAFSRPGRNGHQDVSPKSALVMGCFQALAMIPGISRSGSTTLGGVACGLPRRRAIKFSFMMSAPAVLGSLLMEGKDAYETGAFDFLSGNLLPIAVGVALAALVGYLTIRAMLRFINRISYHWFALYVFVVAAAVLYLQFTGQGGLPPVSLPFL